MKISVSKDFGTAKKPVLPLVPKTLTVNKKEDLAQIDLLSNPADANLTKVKFAFKILEGGTETAPEVIQWMQNVEQAFTGLNSNTVNKGCNSLPRGSALSGFIAGVAQLATPTRLQAVASTQAAVSADDGTDAARANGLNTHLGAMQALTDVVVLDLQALGVCQRETCNS